MISLKEMPPRKLSFVFIILSFFTLSLHATKKIRTKNLKNTKSALATLDQVAALRDNISSRLQKEFPDFINQKATQKDSYDIYSIMKEREQVKAYSGNIISSPALDLTENSQNNVSFNPLITAEQCSLSPKMDREKEKGTEKEIFPNSDDEGFVLLDGKHLENVQWAQEELHDPHVPFGRLLAQAVLPHQKSRQDTTDSLMFSAETLQNLPTTHSIYENLLDLQKKSNKHDQSIDLQSIDSEEWIKLSTIPCSTFDYTWKTKIINPIKRQNGLIAFFLIHGTFVDDVEFGKDLKMKLSLDLMNLAKMYALEHDCAVKVITFKWSGALDEEKRKEAGLILTRYVTSDPECKEAKKIGAYSHSFGGSVLLWLSENLRKYKREVDFAFNVGTPICEVKEKTAVDTRDRILTYVTPEEGFNIGNLYQFFSNGDITQAAGSIHSSSDLLHGKVGIFERRAPFLITKKNKVTNFHFQHEGNLCSHVNIKWFVAGALPYILPIVHVKYPHAHDLNVATCDNNKDHLPIITLRHKIFSSTEDEIQKKSAVFSKHNAQKFFEFYHKPIGKDNPLSFTKLYQEYLHSTLSQENHI